LKTSRWFLDVGGLVGEMEKFQTCSAVGKTRAVDEDGESVRRVLPRGQ